MIKHGATERQFSFWADTKENEEDIFAQLFETLAPFDNFSIYHYGSYETQALKRLNRKFDNRYEDEINWLLEKSVNILSFFSSTIYPPTYTNELKDIARFLGFRWSEQDASGIQSIVWRKRWELSHKVKYKNKLIQYNAEDCDALKLTRNWIAEVSRKIEQEDNEDIVQTTKVKNVKRDSYNWGPFRSQLDDFEKVNRYAYFDYQREKVYLRTNTYVKKALKSKAKKLKSANKINKIVQILPDQCPYCHSKKIYCKYKLKKRTLIDLKFTNSGVKKWIIKVKSGFLDVANVTKHLHQRNTREFLISNMVTICLLG